MDQLKAPVLTGVLSGNLETDRRFVVLLSDFPAAVEKYKANGTVPDLLTELPEEKSSTRKSGFLPNFIKVLFCSSAPESDEPVIDTNVSSLSSSSTITSIKTSAIGEPNTNKLSCKKIDFSDVDQLGINLSQETERIFNLYSGLSKDDSINFQWQLKTTKQKVSVSTSAVPGSTWLAIKSRSVFDADKQAVLNLFLDDSRAKDYDDSLDKVHVIRKIDDKLAIRLFQYKPIWPASGREFLIFTTWRELDSDTFVCCSISPPNDAFPPDLKSAYVRGRIHCSGAIIKDIGGGKCELTMYAHTDLGGYLPTSLLNFLAYGVPVKQHTRLAELCKR